MNFENQEGQINILSNQLRKNDLEHSIWGDILKIFP